MIDHEEVRGLQLSVHNDCINVSIVAEQEFSRRPTIGFGGGHIAD
jgi:hypothetical protein